MKQEVIRIDGLHKGLPHGEHLNNLHFNLYRGEFLGLTGLNSSGKNLLVEILRLNSVPDKGYLFIDEVPIDCRNITEPINYGVGYIGNTSSLIKGLSISENLAIVKRRGGDREHLVNDALLESTARHYLNYTGLGKVAGPGVHIEDLTEPQRHIIEIIKLLHAGADKLILDNICYAFSASDYVNLLDLLRKLKESGISVIYISNFPDLLFDYADRIMVIRSGRNAGTLYHEEYNKRMLFKLMFGTRALTAPLYSNHSNGQELFSIRDVAAAGNNTGLDLTLYGGEAVCFFSLEKNVSDEFTNLFLQINLRRGGKPKRGKKLLINQKWEVTLNGAAREFAVIPQDTEEKSLFRNSSIADNLLLPLYKKNGRSGLVNAGLRRYIADETDDAFKMPRGWSSGVQVRNIDAYTRKKLAFHRVLLLNPSAVLIVYPNNNADPMLQKEIFERIDAMLSTGMSVIIFSNNIQDTLSVCSRLVIFSKSRVVSYMKREEALSEDLPDLIARYS